MGNCYTVLHYDGSNWAEIDEGLPGGGSLAVSLTPGNDNDSMMYWRSSDNGAHVDVNVQVGADFGANTFTFDEQVRVLNSSDAAEGPDAGVTQRHVLTLRLLAESNGRASPGDMAQLRMDFSFDHLYWGINGPVPNQDGEFKIIVPDGSQWGWSMEHNAETGELEITSLNGPSMEDFSFHSGDEAISINGLPFMAGQAITGIAEGPSFTFEIPYDVETDVPFIILQTSHSSAIERAEIPTLSQSGMMIFLVFLLGSAVCVMWARKRQTSM